MDDLAKFMEKITQDPDLEERLANVDSDCQVVEIAKEKGLNFSTEDIVKALNVSKELLGGKDDLPFTEDMLETVQGRLGLILFTYRMLSLKRHDRS